MIRPGGGSRQTRLGVSSVCLVPIVRSTDR
jgi:hypothetical protein